MADVSLVVETGRGTKFVIDGPDVEIARFDQPVARVPLVDLIEFVERNPLTASHSGDGNSISA